MLEILFILSLSPICSWIPYVISFGRNQWMFCYLKWTEANSVGALRGLCFCQEAAWVFCLVCILLVFSCCSFLYVLGAFHLNFGVKIMFSFYLFYHRISLELLFPVAITEYFKLVVAGSKEGRHYFYWTIFVYRKWNYFCLVRGKEQWTCSVIRSMMLCMLYVFWGWACYVTWTNWMHKLIFLSSQK